MSQVEPQPAVVPPVSQEPKAVHSTVVQPEQEATLAQAYIKADEYRRIIESEVLSIIKDLAEKGETPRDRIQDIASSTLTLIHAGMSLEELFTNVVKLDDNFPELAPVVVKVMRIYEEKYEKKALDQVSQLVKGGKFTEANDLVKKVLLFKVT